MPTELEKTIDKLALAFTQVIEKYGVDAVERAYSKTLSGTLRSRLESRYGEQQDSHKISQMLPYPRELLYSTNDRLGWEGQVPPGADHSLLFKGPDGYTFVTQPYGLSFKDMKDLVSYCSKLELKAEIRVGAPHFATSCLLITIRSDSDAK